MRKTAVLTTSVLLNVTLLSPLRAGEVPYSALALSWGIDPILIDSPALLCLFPQRAVVPNSTEGFGVPPSRSVLWATTETAYADPVERNLGALWRGARFGLFALAQPNYLAGGQFAHAGAPLGSLSFFSQPFVNENDVLQVGAGARWGAVRGGLACRATRHRSDSGFQGTRPDGSLSGTQRVVDYRELAFGLGADLGGARVDATFEWQNEEYDEAHGETGSNGSRAITLRGEARGTSGFAVRVGAPVGARVRCIAAGHYRWANRSWSGTRYEAAGTQGIAFGERAKTWGAHLGVVVATPLVERLVFAGSAVHYDEPISGLETSDFMMLLRKASRGTVTVAVEKTVWRTLALRAGVSGEYTEAEVSWQSTDQGQVRDTAQDGLTDRFHWGVSYRWRDLLFETSLRAPPAVDSPFEHFDLYWSF